MHLNCVIYIKVVFAKLIHLNKNTLIKTCKYFQEYKSSSFLDQRRCTSPKPNAIIRDSSWDGVQKLQSEVRHTIRKWTRSHRDRLNIVAW
jgi:hypothetical protein